MSFWLKRTKYFFSLSFISTSVSVSLLLNGNITPALILEKLVGYGKTLLVLLFDIPFMVFTTVDSLIFKAWEGKIYIFCLCLYKNLQHKGIEKTWFHPQFWFFIIFLYVCFLLVNDKSNVLHALWKKKLVPTLNTQYWFFTPLCNSLKCWNILFLIRYTYLNVSPIWWI